MYKFSVYVTKISLRILCVAKVISVPAMIKKMVCKKF
jgi:hypothetical protein